MSTKDPKQPVKNDPVVIGQRVRSIRNLLRLSRPALSKETGVAKTTIQAWEIARFNGLSKAGAQILAETFTRLGIRCTSNWLLYGIGSSPVNTTSHKMFSDFDSIDLANTPHPERPDFNKLFANAIDIIVPDDSLFPFFVAGDLVAGSRLFGDEIKKLVGFPVIIQTKSGEIVLRVLNQGEVEDTFSLTSSNPHFKETKNYNNIEVYSAAEILWYSRKFTSHKKL